MKRICLSVFSTNRLEYLTKTLEAQKYFDFSGCEVDRILIDDMPLHRDDELLRSLAECHGYNEVYLHQENLGIGTTWQQLWDLIRDRNYDYVLQQEDDVRVLERVSVADMIEAFERAPRVSQVVLKRQPWYAHEHSSQALFDDFICRSFRGEFSAAKYFFTPITSLYSMDRVRFDYKDWYARAYPDEPIFQYANINEAIIGKAMIEGLGLSSMHLKGSRGQNLIEHIGVYTIGKKLLPHEPGFEAFADLDPTVKYISGTNRPYSEQGIRT
jgi:hypothetical protein